MKVLSIILGVLLIIGGIYCVMTPGATFLSLGLILGISMLIDGFGAIAEYLRARKLGYPDGWVLAGGIGSVVLGVFLAFSNRMQFFTDALIAYTAGLWVFGMGITRIVRSIRIYQYRKTLPQEARGSVWLWTLILGIIMLVFGAYGFFHPMLMVFTLGVMLGYAIILSGINLITLGSVFSA